MLMAAVMDITLLRQSGGDGFGLKKLSSARVGTIAESRTPPAGEQAGSRASVQHGGPKVAEADQFNAPRLAAFLCSGRKGRTMQSKAPP
jgi:hypothetical protein